MNKLWILIVSAMVFIPVFSYAEEEKCDQAIIDNGVELMEAYDKAHDALPEDARDQAWDAYDQALAALPEKQAMNKALVAYRRVRDALPERRAYYQASDELDQRYSTTNSNSYFQARDAYKRVRESLPEYVIYRSVAESYRRVRESLPEYGAYNQARDAYQKILEGVILPEDQALRSFEEVNIECMKDIRKAYVNKNCDQAIIDNGVELMESYEKALVVLSEDDYEKKAKDARDQAKEAYDQAKEAYKKAKQSLPELVVLEMARDAYRRVRDALPEWRAYDQASDDIDQRYSTTNSNSYFQARDAYEKARKALYEAEKPLPELAALERTLERTDEAYRKVHDALPEYVAYNQARDAYQKILEGVILPEDQALRSFVEANEEKCENYIYEAYTERKQRLSNNRSYSGSNRSGSSSNSDGSSSQRRSSGSKSSKAVQ